jgi:hypothetical protein
MFLAILLIAAYASWTHDDGSTKSDEQERVEIYSAKPDDIKALSMITNTATVSIERREDPTSKKGYIWFDIKMKTAKHGFVGNNETKALFESVAPLQAIRSFGTKLSDKEISDLKLDHASSKLVVRMSRGDRVLDVGGRTYGGRDFYVRPQGGKEVFLVAAKVLGDLEYPDSKYMQRKLRDADVKDISALVIKAGGKEHKLLHKNRLAAKDAFWADQDKPDEKSDTAENYIHKVDLLTATHYPSEEKPFPSKSDPVAEFEWYEDDKLVETIHLSRAGNVKDLAYYATSSATHGVMVEVPKSSGEQIERDLATIFAGTK